MRLLARAKSRFWRGRHRDSLFRRARG
jgi:hypothetical protein